METYIYDDYLMHHGIKGQKWGVRRTPEQLGHAVSKGRQNISSFFENAKANRQAKISAKNKAQLAKYKAKEKAQQEKINVVNQKLAVKQQKAELKQLKKSLHSSRYSTSGKVAEASKNYISKRHAQRQEQKRLDRLARQQAVRNAKSQLLQNTIVNVTNAGVKVAATSLANNPEASEGARLFAKYMGGEEKTQPKNSLDLLKSKRLNEMSDEELKNVNTRLQTMNRIDTILDAERKKYNGSNGSSQNGNYSYGLSVRR